MVTTLGECMQYALKQEKSGEKPEHFFADIDYLAPKDGVSRIYKKYSKPNCFTKFCLQSV